MRRRWAILNSNSPIARPCEEACESEIALQRFNLSAANYCVCLIWRSFHRQCTATIGVTGPGISPEYLKFVTKFRLIQVDCLCVCPFW